MAEIRTERKMLAWPFWLVAATIGSLLLGLLVLMPLYGRPNYEVGLYDATRPVASLQYRGQVWKPEGRPLSLGDNKMVAIGQSDEGYLLYANRDSDLVGGGGGKPEMGAHPTEYKQVYLRTREGHYQPVTRK